MARVLSPPPWLLAILLALAFLAIYIRTAAPGLLSGDSAELQLAAVTLGVAHPTTYPLYTLLGYLAVRLIPFGEPAWRVTLVSAGCAALAVGLHALLLLRAGISRRAALLGAALLGVTPGLWNAATLTEVYALLALLMVASALGIQAISLPSLAASPGTRSSDPTAIPAQPSCFQIGALGLLAGLGFTHHGLFVITILPLWGLWVGWRTLRGLALHRVGSKQQQAPSWAAALVLPLLSLLGFAIGLLPWLYPLIQYARLGPFTGEDYGLPQHYYWGAPASWGAVIDLLTGGSVRRGIFRLPGLDQALATCSMLGERALFEVGWPGVILALLGCIVLWQRSRIAWPASVWVVLVTAGYLLLLGPAVADAPIFTLPMLIPLTLWAAIGIDTLLQLPARMSARLPRLQPQPGPIPAPAAHASAQPRPGLGWRHWQPISHMLIPTLLLVVWLGWWADTRVEYASKRHLTLYRSFGEAVLHEVPTNAVVIAHWEQGMVLQYLRLAERQRPDVWVDVVEPSDEAWRMRIARRYSGREVFLIGQAPDVEGLPVILVREDDYAQLFQLRK